MGAEVGDAANAAVPAARPARTPLGTGRIIHEAIAFIDEEGLSQLTMRRLGRRLGVEAMALYRYVPGREHLLDGIVEVLMDDLYRDTFTDVEEARNWPEYLQRMAYAVRNLATTHPRIFPLVATRPPAAPWLRPPLRSLRWVESFLAGLASFGFGRESSVAVYHAFSTFLLGHLLLETSTVAEELLPADADLEVVESSDLADYPRVSDLEPLLREDGYAAEFADALEDLIDRLTRLTT